MLQEAHGQYAAHVQLGLDLLWRGISHELRPQPKLLEGVDVGHHQGGVAVLLPDPEVLLLRLDHAQVGRNHGHR